MSRRPYKRKGIPGSEITTEHERWCVRKTHTGACSWKRGHWDRQTNTWDSDLTSEQRKMIKTALIRWRRKGEPAREVAEWVRTHEGYENATGHTLVGWLMTYRKEKSRGNKWPC